MDDKKVNQLNNEEPEKIEIDDSISTQMDIFTKGFVNPLNDMIKEVKEEIPYIELEKNDKIEVNNDDQIKSKAVKTNEEQMTDNVAELIDELNEDEEVREIKRRKRRKVRNLLLTIGIVLEIIIIVFICYKKFIKVTYASEMTCTNEIHNDKEKYSITTKNIYYFDKQDKVAKTENTIIYKFDTDQSYKEYKDAYADSSIKNYKGIKQTNKFDDKNYTYEASTIYNYSDLRKNNKVDVANNLITAKIPDRAEPITLYIQTVDDVLKQNQEIGFVCE